MSNLFYHYCPLDTFLKIVESKGIWLTNIFCMNDSAEHSWLRKVAKDVLRRKRDLPEKVSDFLASELFPKEDKTDLYCFCMSNLGDSLGQWRAYADDGRGVAVGFSYEYLRAAEKEYRGTGLRLKRICYDPGTQAERVESILEAVMEGSANPPHASSVPTELLEELAGLVAKVEIWFEAARCKNPCFSEEREVRLIYDASRPEARKLGERRYRARGDTLVPCYALPLTLQCSFPPIFEVVLGPKSNRDFNEPIVEQLLSGNGYDVSYLTVRHSEATYR